ncbi:Hypothetical protein CM240_3372 [Clostridium bornimense]|uniref:Uncharacterized protein n=1 Tax=Clostridium bornimense TaxID=1216932 RepID=W6S3J6_9CLOT|nr:hypothetical protein [Clostridium bornimense]CDM70489.1 Hypothetical protein CM240_3372 [Clostridium bornimense]
MRNLSIILIILLSITLIGCETKKSNSNIENNSTAIENNSDSSTDYSNTNENNSKSFTTQAATEVLDDIYSDTENINYGCTEDLYIENGKTFYLFRITTLKETSSKIAGSVGYIKVYSDYSVSSVFTSYYDAINNIN